MHTPLPFNSRYTMNWFLLSLINDHLNQLLNWYSRIQALRLDLFYQKGTERYKRHSWNETEREVRMLVERTPQNTNLSGFSGYWRELCRPRLAMRSYRGGSISTGTLNPCYLPNS